MLDGWCRRPGLLEPKTEGSHRFYCASCTRSYWPIVFKTELVLAGMSKAQMFENIKSSFDKKDLPTRELGSMCHMMSRDQYLSDANGHWHPHLMFFLPQTSDVVWGARVAGLSRSDGSGPLRSFNRVSDSSRQVAERIGRTSDDNSVSDSHKH